MASTDDEADEGGAYTWLIGVGLMTVGSILNNLGNNLMSLGHKEQSEIDSLNFKRTASMEVGGVRSPEQEVEINRLSQELETKQKQGTWWLTGTVIFVIGALFTFVSFGFAAQSLLAAIESVQFVSQVFFQKFVHGIEITKRIVYSTACILAGNIIVIAFSTHSSHMYNAKQITEIYIENTGYHIYLAVSGAIWFAAHGTFMHYEKGRLIGQYYWRHNKTEPFAFVVSATLIGTQSVLMAKCLSMLMMLCFDNDNQFKSKYAATLWVVLILWILFAAVYIQRINKGLGIFAVTFFIPTMTVCFAFFTIVAGGIFFHEFEAMSDLAFTMFFVGTALIFIGVSQLEAAEPEPVGPSGDDDGESTVHTDDDGRSVPGLSIQTNLATGRKSRPSALYPRPTAVVIAENRTEIKQEFDHAVHRASIIMQDGLSRARERASSKDGGWFNTSPRASTVSEGENEEEESVVEMEEGQLPSSILNNNVNSSPAILKSSAEPELVDRMGIENGMVSPANNPQTPAKDDSDNGETKA